MKTNYHSGILLLIISTVVFLSGCNSQAERAAASAPDGTLEASHETADVEFTLQTIVNDGGLAYIGIGGVIDSVVNPDLIVQPGEVVRIILLNGDGMPHDLFLPDFDVKTSYVNKVGDQTEIIFEVGDMQPGTYVYYCTVPGHRQAGQEGNLIVKESS